MASVDDTVDITITIGDDDEAQINENTEDEETKDECASAGSSDYVVDVKVMLWLSR